MSQSRTEKRLVGSSWVADAMLKWGSRGGALIAVSIILFIIAFLVGQALPAIVRLDARQLIADDGWYPRSGQFNLTPMLLATLLATAGAVFIATPLGLAVAVFSQWYAPRWMAVIFGRLVELLAGIPSVVFGLWGLVVLAPRIAQFGGSGQCLLTATLVLSLMVLPTIALTCRAAFQAVPSSQIQGALALGMDRWVMVRRVAIPAARSGVFVGVLLAVTCALGETMAVLMLAGNVVAVPDSLVAPVRLLTANIALEMGDATADHRAVLFLTGLVLMTIVFLLVIGKDWLGGRLED